MLDMKTLRSTARERMKGFCSLCRVCNGVACAGQMPGMGSPGSGASFQQNHKALADVKINLRAVHGAVQPDTSIDFFGTKLSTPIINGPIGSAKINCGPYENYEFQRDLVLGMKQAGSVGTVGDPGNPAAFDECCRAISDAGSGGAFIKPHVDLDEIKKRIDMAKEAGATFFGMDVDGAGIMAMAKQGYPVSPKTPEELKKIRSFAPNDPFIVKGIMTVDEALLCIDAGADGIIVSNHGGRVLDCTAGVAEVLPSIKKAVGDRIHVYADGAVRSGVDTLKYLAMGAEAVMIGRPACWGAFGAAADGVQLIVDSYSAELRQAMILTGAATIKDIDERIIFSA